MISYRLLEMTESTLFDNEPTGGRPVLNFQKDSKWAFIALACGFCTQVLILGVLHAFGFFFLVFITDFNTTKGTAAWVGSISYGLSMLIGPFSSALVNRFGNRTSMMSGGLLCFVALLASSFVTDINLLFFTFSFIYGIGACLSITPTMTLGQDYFDKYLSLSVGVMTSGSSVGTLVMAPTTQALIKSIGWRNTFRLYAVTCLLTFLFNFCVFPINAKRKTTVDTLKTSPLRRLILELALWKNRVFIVWTIGITLVMFGYYIPYVHLISYAVDIGISPEEASILVMVLGASTAIGRLTFGKIVQLGILDRLHLHQLSMIVSGSSTIFLPVIRSFTGLLTFIIIFGFVDGCFVVLLPLLTCSLVNADKAVLAWGFLIGSASITFTIGPPVAGLMYDHFGSYDIAFHVAGIPVITGALTLFLIPWAQRTSSTSTDMEIVEEVMMSEDGADVDFITLSRSSSVLGRNQGSQMTLSSWRQDVRSVQSVRNESPRSQKAYSFRGTPECDRHRRMYRPSRLYDKNDQLVSQMLEGSSKGTLDGYYPSMSITPGSRYSSSRKSDFINVSPSYYAENNKTMSSIKSTKTYGNVGVQTDAYITESFTSFFLPTVSQLCQNHNPSTPGSAMISRTSLMEDSQTSSSIDQTVMEQIGRLRDTLTSPSRAAELLEDPSPQWISNNDLQDASCVKVTKSVSEYTDATTVPISFDEALVPAETTSCALSPKGSTPTSGIMIPLRIKPNLSSVQTKETESNNDIFPMDPLSPPGCLLSRCPSDIPSVKSPLSTNPSISDQSYLSDEKLFYDMLKSAEGTSSLDEYQSHLRKQKECTGKECGEDQHVEKI